MGVTYKVLENHPQDSRIKIKEDGIFQTMGRRGGMEYEPHTLLVLAMETISISHNDYMTKPSVEIVDALLATTHKDPPAVLEGKMNHVVRRLTPLECERLQGYPDGWTNIGEWKDTKGKVHKESDSPRYKALGNSIALPFWEWMAARMVKYIDHEPTMASLFDGIGGFPLVYSRCGCRPVWASEIEEFPIAVTKIRFPEE